MYFSQDVLAEIVAVLMRVTAPSCAGVTLRQLPGPHRYRNWRIDSIDVTTEEEAVAWSMVEVLEQASHWIMVPSGHMLDGQIIGRERASKA